MEVILVLIRSSLVYLNFNDLAFLNNSLGLASLTCELRVDDLALAAASVAGAALLHHHAWAHLPDAVDYPAPTAITAGCNLGASLSIAVGADSVALDGYLCGLTII